MTRNGSIWILTAALALSGLATPARAQQVSDARLRELITQAADRAATGNLATDSQPPTTSAAGQRPIVRLTLDDAVKFALDRNLDIAVQRLNPEINDLAVARIRTWLDRSRGEITFPRSIAGKVGPHLRQNVRGGRTLRRRQPCRNAADP